MSSYTDFLNLFKWNPQEDAEEEFDIDKALNDNWGKIDVKLENYINSVNTIIDNFKTSTNEAISAFESAVNAEIEELANSVANLSELINQTQNIYKYTMTVTQDTALRSRSNVAVLVQSSETVAYFKFNTSNMFC